MAEWLPEYLRPATLTVLDAWPLTPNGKVDRSKLPVPDTAGTDQRAPETVLEELLCGVFADALGLREVGVLDDFFELGGHSLLAPGLIGRAVRAGLRLDIADLFTHRTAAGLAAVAGRRQAPEQAAAWRGEAMGRVFDDAAGIGELDPVAPVLPIRPDGDLAPLFFVHSGVGFALPYIGLARHLESGHPVYGLQSPALSGDGRLPDSVAELADGYLARIREIQPAGPYHLFGWSFGGLVVHELAVRLREAGENVALVVNMDGYPEHDQPADPRTESEMLAGVLEVIGHDRAGFEGRELTRTTCSPCCVRTIIRCSRWARTGCAASWRCPTGTGRWCGGSHPGTTTANCTWWSPRPNVRTRLKPRWSTAGGRSSGG